MKCVLMVNHIQYILRRSFAGAWIEIQCICGNLRHPSVAPSQERGLKFDWKVRLPKHSGRSFAGAWIEIAKQAEANNSRESLLRRSVD